MPVTVLRKAEWTATAAEPKPDVSFMPMLERRRLSLVERVALHVAWKIYHPEGAEPMDVPPASDTPVVFASRWGEIGTTLKLMRQMHEEGEMSPAGFSSSVHNAAPGAWSLFAKSHAAYTAIAARERSYEMGLLEAEAQLASRAAPAILYIYAEETTPEYYMPEFGECVTAHASARLLVPSEGA